MINLWPAEFPKWNNPPFIFGTVHYYLSIYIQPAQTIIILLIILRLLSKKSFVNQNLYTNVSTKYIFKHKLSFVRFGQYKEYIALVNRKGICFNINVRFLFVAFFLTETSYTDPQVYQNVFYLQLHELAVFCTCFLGIL